MPPTTSTSIGTWAPTPTFLYRHRLYRRLIGRKPQKFLDIGTGTGFLLKYLAENHFFGDAIDTSLKALTFAKKSLLPSSKINLKHTDFVHLSTTHKYSQIFCFEVLEYVNRPQTWINKIARHLHPQGKLFISVPAHSQLWNQLDFKRGHLHRFEKHQLISWFNSAGFTVTTFWSYGFPFLTWLRSLNRHAWLVKQSPAKPQNQLRHESALIQEYPPLLRWLLNPLLLTPFFWIMDMFLHANLGIGYIIEAVYQPHSKLASHTPPQNLESKRP